MINISSIGSKITRDCRSEMIRHRKFLMEDYRLSPEVVSRCSDDIEDFCRGLEAGGKTIHCLLEHSRPKRRRQKVVSTPCQRAVRIFHLYAQNPLAVYNHLLIFSWKIY